MLDLPFSGRRGVQKVITTSVRDCAIESVVVFADRAEVRRAVPVTLAAGENEVVIYGLSSCMDTNSIRVEGKGNAMITDVIYSSKTTPEETESSPGSKEDYDALKEEEKACDEELKRLTFKEEVLNEEKQLLVIFANHVSDVHSVKGKDDSLAQLLQKDNVVAVLEFFEKYEAKVADLDSRLSMLTKEKEMMNEKIAVLKANADMINPSKISTSSETVRTIHVSLETTEETEGILFLSYVVSNASWSSSYDVRVFTKDKAMKVQYYGLIQQQTGEDWNNAKMALSTAQPSIGGSAPDLPTRIIRFRRPKPAVFSWEEDCIPLCDHVDVKSIRQRPAVSSGSRRKKSMSAPRAAAPPPPPCLKVAVAEVSTGLFNANYAIPRAATIPADNTEHKVTVALVDLCPEFHYKSVPRLSPHSFLQAKAKNTSPYTMLAGPANIFLDNNFIAKSVLADVSPNEEFTTSLGVDQSLRITCQPVEVVHNTRSGLLGNKVASITYTHHFRVKNTKTHSVSIQLYEQVPLSSDDRVKVQVLRPEVRKAQVKCSLACGHAILNDSNNMEWHVSVESGAELELQLVYSVEHPVQDHVQGLPKH